MSKIHTAGPAEVVGLGRKGVYEISFSLEDNWTNIEALLQKYTNLPISLADASLIRCAETYQEGRTLSQSSSYR